MTVQTQSPRDLAVAAAIREISHIATLPEVTLKIIDLVEDPSSTAQDLNKVIANDPALSTRILKVVNSAFYGLPGQIGSINRAIVLLGLNAVKNIAIAASLTKLFKGGQITPTFSARDLWMHSVTVAVASKMIADSLKLALTDEAFLCGLVHDIGLMVEIQFDRNKLAEALKRTEPDASGKPTVSLLETEEQVFGANHQDFGMALADKWKFPKTFAYVTGFHHRPLELPAQHRTLACIISVADCIAAEMKGGFRLDMPSSELNPAVLDDLKLSREVVERVKSELPAHLENSQNLLS